MENLFLSVFEGDITPKAFFICTAVSLVLGAALALSYMFKNRYSGSFVITLALLPSIIQLVMMLVNGNIGTGVAVMGAFSLVRFRSAPGSAREILAIFAAMAVGLATGVGFVGIAAVFTIIFIIMSMLYTEIGFGKAPLRRRRLKITVPESLDYTEVFDGIMNEYTLRHELIRVKTTNLGSLFQLTYDITLKDPSKEKVFLDGLRTRNGNLEIVCSRDITAGDEL